MNKSMDLTKNKKEKPLPTPINIHPNFLQKLLQGRFKKKNKYTKLSQATKTSGTKKSSLNFEHKGMITTNTGERRKKYDERWKKCPPAFKPT